jgi:hypothetical protein
MPRNFALVFRPWFPGLRFHFLQALDRLTDGRIESGAPSFQMRVNLGAHPRIPEFFDVVGSPGGGLNGV